jgi:hypothetical protein
VSTYDDDETDLEFFEEPATLEAPGRPRRRIRSPRGGGPRRPSPPPPGAVALARLAGLVALAIAVVVGLVFWVGSCQGQSKHDEYKAYMDKVLPIAQSSGRHRDDGALEGAELPEAHARRLAVEARAVVAAAAAGLQRGAAPGTARAAAGRAPAGSGDAPVARDRLTGLANTLATAGSKDATQVGELLAKQAQVLSASDLVWADLFRLPATETLRSQGVQGVAAPPSQIVSNPVVITPHSFEEVYAALASTSTNGKVTGLHGSELVSTEAVSGGQTKTLTVSSPTTVDVAANLAFKVTFKNGGNFREVKVPVTLEVSVFPEVGVQQDAEGPR